MNDKWSTKELETAVYAYVDMLQKEARGEPFVKKSYYKALAKQFGRTEKSYEYRMQNISYVYSLMGRRWVTGLKPAKNVGARVAGVLEGLINKIEGQELPKVAEFESIVSSLRKIMKGPAPMGTKAPGKYNVQTTQYNRDAEVVAWILNVANGVCEVCVNDAPFIKQDGSPFLEVHHLRRLADGGSDTIYNAIAACPNCHRELHYGSNKKLFMDSVYEKVKRLILE